MTTFGRHRFQVSLRELCLATLALCALAALWREHSDLAVYRHYGGIVQHKNGSVTFRLRNGWVLQPVEVPETETPLTPAPAPPPNWRGPAEAPDPKLTWTATPTGADELGLGPLLESFAAKQFIPPVNDDYLAVQIMLNLFKEKLLAELEQIELRVEGVESNP